MNNEEVILNFLKENEERDFNSNEILKEMGFFPLQFPNRPRDIIYNTLCDLNGKGKVILTLALGGFDSRWKAMRR